MNKESISMSDFLDHIQINPPIIPKYPKWNEITLSSFKTDIESKIIEVSLFKLTNRYVWRITVDKKKVDLDIPEMYLDDIEYDTLNKSWRYLQDNIEELIMEDLL